MKKLISKFTGVSFAGASRSMPWRSRITISGSTLDLGYFSTQVEAAKAYNDFVLGNSLNRTLNKVR